MWPWEHLAVGYVLVSLLWRLGGERPALPAALAVALGTQFPDLVDKPLAWHFGVLDSGLAVGHSLLVLVPLCTLLVVVAHRVGYTRAAAAFTVGYLSHIAGDAVHPMLFGEPFRWTVFFWPLSSGADEGSVELIPRIIELFTKTSSLAAGPQGSTYIAFELLLLLTALALWTLDGAPGLPRFRSNQPRLGGR